MKYLDGVSLARLNNLRLELRRLSAEGHSAGRHRSAHKGLSHDFAQHRAYAPGDELKTLDWKVFARQDRYYVKEYQAENVLTTHVLLDASGSMGFSHGGRAPKWELACRLALSVAYLVIGQGDAVGLSTFDVDLKDALPPRASFSHLELMDTALSKREPGGETDLARVLERAAARIKRRSLVVVVSDLLGDPERVAKVVRALKARRHEVVVFQVLDPAERDFPFEGPTVFESLETAEELFCEAGAVAGLYRREFDRLLKLYEASFHAGEAGYQAFFTDQPWDAALSRFLSRWS